MKWTALIFALSMLSMPSLAADQWLCTAEKMTTITRETKGEMTAFAADSDANFVVSKDGLKWVGADDYHFSAKECTADADGGIDCNSSLRRKGFMNMTVFKKLAVFYYYQIVFTESFFGPLHHVSHAGNCEKR